MKTSEFRTRSIFKHRNNGCLENFWPIGLDIGYGGCKVFGPNIVACFPSYAKKIESNSVQLGHASEDDILYRDNATGELWVVGRAAQNMLTTDDTNDNAASLFARNRYTSPMYKILARVGIALTLQQNEGDVNSVKGKAIVVQTGLPSDYVDTDKYEVIENLSGLHDFSLKIGSGKYINYCFELPEKNIRVMPQPFGTLTSIVTDKNGKQTANATEIFNQNTIIVDPGFNTLDTFGIKNRIVDTHFSWDKLGMKRILQETSDEIYRQHKERIPIAVMQKYLETGNITKFNRKEMRSEEVDFTSILEEMSKKIFKEAMATVGSAYNDFRYCNNLVITGGTGAAWSNYIRDYFKNMQTIKIISGSLNDDLPMLFANVRGYFYSLVNSLKK